MASTWLTYNGNVLASNGSMLAPVNSENPLNLPAKTMRLKFTAGLTPESSLEEFFSLVDPAENIWDYSDQSDRWSIQTRLYSYRHYLTEVLGGNLEGVITTGVAGGGMFYGFDALTDVDYIYMPDVTNASGMFTNCSALKRVTITNAQSLENAYNMFGRSTALEYVSIPVSLPVLTNAREMFYACLNLPSLPYFVAPLTNMKYMCWNCYLINSVPLYNTEFVTDMTGAFGNCYMVESGTLSMYQQASSQANPPTSHDQCFSDCGRDTSASAELAQIPSSWGGTKP